MAGPMHTEKAIAFVEEQKKIGTNLWCPITGAPCHTRCVCYKEPYYHTNGHPDHTYAYEGYCSNPMLTESVAEAINDIAMQLRERG